MAEFHFVEDYERQVQRLITDYPIDEAMSLAVGGGYETVGKVEAGALHYLGLRDGMHLIDLGCGSGRLASVVREVASVTYLGIDVVQALLDYAAVKSPATYTFVLHRELNIPAPDASADYVSAFSVFTHLLLPETYIYLEDIKRVLRREGRLVFSFLELASNAHWGTFIATVAGHRQSKVNHLNTFIERAQIEVWCRHLGFSNPRFIDPDAAPWGGNPLGQTIAVISK